jgi:hygromycin-B 4-O-kinase
VVWVPVRIALPEAVEFLRRRYGGDVRRVGPVAEQGLWSSTYRFTDGGVDRVVRFGPSREAFERDAFVARHASPRLPVPQVREIGEAFGHAFAVSDFVRGRIIDNIDAAEMGRTLPSLFQALDAVREIDLSATAGFGYWDAAGRGVDPTWEYVLLGGIPRWRAAVAGSAVGLGPFEEGVARMLQLVPFSPPVRHLVHSDLLHRNVLVEDGRITALLDWGSSFIGDFVYDIAWLSFWQPWYPQWAGLNFVAAAAAHYAAAGVVVEHFAERVRCYELRIAVSNQEWFAERGDRANLEKVAARTLELAAGRLGPA